MAQVVEHWTAELKVPGLNRDKSAALFLFETHFSKLPDLQELKPILTQLDVTKPGYLELRSTFQTEGQAPRPP